MVRTRLMNQPPDAKLYSGAFDCVGKILANEGPQGFYRGFVPIWMRFAPTTCLQLIIFEQLQGAMGMKGCIRECTIKTNPNICCGKTVTIVLFPNKSEDQILLPAEIIFVRAFCFDARLGSTCRHASPCVLDARRKVSNILSKCYKKKK